MNTNTNIVFGLVLAVFAFWWLGSAAQHDAAEACRVHNECQEYR